MQDDFEVDDEESFRTALHGIEESTGSTADVPPLVIEMGVEADGEPDDSSFVFASSMGDRGSDPDDGDLDGGKDEANKALLATGVVTKELDNGANWLRRRYGLVYRAMRKKVADFSKVLPPNTPHIETLAKVFASVSELKTYADQKYKSAEWKEMTGATSDLQVFERYKELTVSHPELGLVLSRSDRDKRPDLVNALFVVWLMVHKMIDNALVSETVGELGMVPTNDVAPMLIGQVAGGSGGGKNVAVMIDARDLLGSNDLLNMNDLAAFFNNYRRDVRLGAASDARTDASGDSIPSFGGAAGAAEGVAADRVDERGNVVNPVVDRWSPLNKEQLKQVQELSKQSTSGYPAMIQPDVVEQPKSYVTDPNTGVRYAVKKDKGVKVKVHPVDPMTQTSAQANKVFEDKHIPALRFATKKNRYIYF